MEYVKNGDLYQKILVEVNDDGEQVFKPLPADEARIIMAQLFRAFEFLHEKRVAHRDLKPQVCSRFGVNVPSWLM